MEAKEAMLKRRSVREFKDIEVNDEQIKDLLEAAMAAPSAMNKQPWEFYVIRDEKIVNEIKTIHRYYNYNSKCIIVVCGNMLNTIPTAESFWIQDCSSALTNMLNEATNIGLGTVWCGIHPMKARIKSISKILKLPLHIVPLGLVHVGIPAKDIEPRTQYKESKVHKI